MKNLKNIIMTAFIAITLTEMSYPIFLTGPARRNAHREQTEEAATKAYEAGLMTGLSHGQENSEEPQVQDSDVQDNVAVQSMYNDEDMDFDYSFHENYADDGNVILQSLGDGSFASQLSPEEKMALKAKVMEKLKNRDGQGSEDSVRTQSLESRPSLESYDMDDVETQSLESRPSVESYDYMDDVETQALEVVSAEAIQKEATSAAQDKPVVEALTDAVKAEEAMEVAAQARGLTTPVTADAVLEIEKAEPVLATEPLLAELAIEAKPVIEEIKEISVQKESPVVPTATEQIKIIKVYPVFDALRSAALSVKAAAQDMMNYLYSLLASKKSQNVTVQGDFRM